MRHTVGNNTGKTVGLCLDERERHTLIERRESENIHSAEIIADVADIACEPDMPVKPQLVYPLLKQWAIVAFAEQQ